MENDKIRPVDLDYNRERSKPLCNYSDRQRIILLEQRLDHLEKRIQTLEWNAKLD